MYRILIFSNQQRYRLSLSKEYAISRYSLNSMYLITASVDHKWGGAYSLHPKTAQKTPCKRVRSHFQQSLDITRSKTVHAEMNITRQKVGLSFSIENILRDDFCHSRRTNTNVETRERYFAAECWPTSPAYTCYAVPYGPMFMKYLPTTNRLNVGVRLHRVNGENDHFLAEQTKIIDDDCISCKNEETYSDNHGEFVYICFN